MTSQRGPTDGSTVEPQVPTAQSYRAQAKPSWPARRPLSPRSPLTLPKPVPYRGLTGECVTINPKSLHCCDRLSFLALLFHAFFMGNLFPMSYWFLSRACELTNDHVCSAGQEHDDTVAIGSPWINISRLEAVSQHVPRLQGRSKSEQNTYLGSKGLEPLSPLCCCQPPRAPYH